MSPYVDEDGFTLIERMASMPYDEAFGTQRIVKLSMYCIDHCLLLTGAVEWVIFYDSKRVFDSSGLIVSGQCG